MKYFHHLENIIKPEAISDCFKNLRLLIIALEIIDILEHKVFCVTRKDIKKRIKGPYKKIIRVLEDLTSLGVLYRYGNGQKENPYLYFLKRKIDSFEKNISQQIGCL